MKIKSRNSRPVGIAVATVIFAACLSACGVRGKPQPPLVPAELGRGEPGFKRASEEFAFPNVPTPTPSVQPKAGDVR